MAAFDEEWVKRYQRRWWQKVIDLPLDLLATVLEWSHKGSALHQAIGNHLDEPPTRVGPSEKPGEDRTNSE
jgi:hypothetical protein